MGIQSAFKGWLGEVQTKITQNLFLDSEEYRKFNDIILSDENGGTIRIDHIVVSRYGVFVIETRNMKGWIYGGKENEKWTCNYYGDRELIQNPLRQNFLHTRTLAMYIQIPCEFMHPVVIFWGDCKLKTEMPDNVISGGLRGATEYIRSKNEILLSGFEVDIICSKLARIKSGTPFPGGFRYAGHVRDG